MSDQLNPGPNGRSRIHIQKRIDEADVVINVFGNDPDETYDLFVQFLKLVAGEPTKQRPTQAQRELANAELKARQIAQKQQGQPDTVSAALRNHDLIPPPANAPLCNNCGVEDQMKLIRWTDKATGQPMRAWKCQSCNQWWRP